MLILRLSGKAKEVFATWDVIVAKVGNLTLGEFQRLEELPQGGYLAKENHEAWYRAR